METKTKAQHTPGPWKYGEHSTEIYNSDGYLVAKLVAEPLIARRYRIEQAKINGHLIAAAPELLEAAKEALEIVAYAKKFLKYQRPGHEFYPNRESAEGTESRLVAAIAKAEGR